MHYKAFFRRVAAKESVQQSAFSGQRSAISVQRSAFSNQRSAVSVQQSAFSGQLTCPQKPAHCNGPALA
jgi:hypothetical protein